MVINTNIASINAQRHLENSRADMETSMERLASGKRINSAVDDAAGGAIASRMETRVSGMEQLIRNVNDGVSMVQIAESAMGEVNNMLQRMRDLAIQSTNSTLNSTDRATLQLEVDQLIEEINTIAATTQFNGQNILSGSGVTNSIQSGLNAGEAVAFTIGGVSATQLGLSSGTNGVAYSGRVTTSGTTSAGDITINGVDLNAFGAGDVTSAAAMADAINERSSLTGVTADAYNRVEGNVVGLGELAIGEVKVGTVSMGSSFASLNALAAAINEKAADVTAEVTSEGRIVLSNTTGKDIVLDGAGLSAAGFEEDTATSTDSTNTYTGFLKFTNNDGSSDPITFGIDADVGEESDLKIIGLNQVAANGSVTGGEITGTTLAEDAITINGVSIGAVESATASAYMSAINAITDETGVTATSLTEYTFEVASAAANLRLDISAAANTTTEFTVNGVNVTYTADSSVETIVTAINTAVNDMGIFAETNEDGEVRLYSTSGLTIEVDGDNWNSGTAGTTTSQAIGKLTLSSADGGTISVSSLADTDAERATTVAKAGFTYSNEYSADGSGLNIGSAAAASSALKTLDDSITLLSNNRAEMGAYLKRFEAETSNLQVAVEKTAAALSAIKDADYAVESANLAKAQVLQQAGTAMLAQANASTQNVLSLLK
jgi:flagellin